MLESHDRVKFIPARDVPVASVVQQVYEQLA